jgi:hypothetical protein
MLLKNYRFTTFFKVIPLRVLMDNLAFLYRIGRGEFRAAFAITRAYVSILLLLPSLPRRRAHLRVPGTASDFQVMSAMYPRSIVWDYFVLNRTKFSDLLAGVRIG